MQNPHYSQLQNFSIEQAAPPADSLETQPIQVNFLDSQTLKIKFVLPITFLLLMLPLTLIMLLLSVARPTGNIDPAIGVLQTISYISESNPIVDIWPITGSQICAQEGYEPASLGFWRGTYQGCYCPETNRIERRECLTSELPNKCRNIAEQPEIETFTWNGDRFCVRRMTDFIRTADSCSDGYRKCGHLLCVRVGEDCPISDVQIKKSSDARPGNYIERALTLDRKLIFANLGTSNKQLVQFTSEIDRPCLNYNAFELRVNNRSNVLEKEDHMAGCREFGQDVEAEALDNILEKDFNEFNNITASTANIPGYEDIINESFVTLAARYRYITKKIDQCAQYYISDVPELVANVEDFAYLYRGTSISGVIFSFITFIIAAVYIEVIKRNGLAMVNKDEPFGKRFLLQIILLHCLYAIVTTVLGNIALSKVNAQEAYLKELGDLDCFVKQALLNKALDDVAIYLTNRIDGLVFVNNIIAFVTLGTTVAVIGNLLFRKRHNYEPSPPEQSQTI